LWRQRGGEGWSYDDVEPYFRRAERYRRELGKHYGTEGPLGIEGPRWENPLADAFIAASEAVGLRRVDDFGGSMCEGSGYHDLTTWRARRSSTSAAYLAPNRRRPNLQVLANALVHRIEFDGRRATGVVYERDGARFTVHAAGEVIVSAGAVQTPLLLQRSGLGRAELLARCGVPVVQALNGVGENLMDHLQAGRAYETASRFTLNAVMSRRWSMLGAGADYLFRRRGPLTVGAALAGGFAKTRSDIPAPDIQISFSPFLNDQRAAGLSKRSGFLLGAYQVRPESRGYVRITSADPRAEPSIRLNALSTDNERKTLVAGLKLLRRIAEAEPLARLGTAEVTPELAGRADDDDRLLHHIEHTGRTAFHYSGTARMGTDALAVVDPALRVHGVEGLRVIDASVMPTVTSGNTNAAAIMIGEKGADLVKRRR
jgi:choline dehydrogenase